jgi:hypothetical protein
VFLGDPHALTVAFEFPGGEELRAGQQVGGEPGERDPKEQTDAGRRVSRAGVAGGRTGGR